MIFLRAITGAGFTLALSYSIWAFPLSASELPGRPSLKANATEFKIPQTVCMGRYIKAMYISTRFNSETGKPQRQLCKYDYRDSRPKYYEQIHFAPRGIGNNPSDPRNLWSRPRSSAWEAGKKEQPKLVTSRMVCTQEITLAEFLQAISANWIETWKKLCVVRVTFMLSL